MKNFLLFTLCLSLFWSKSLYSQHKYFTKSASITFDSRLDSFVPIKATNDATSAVFESDNGDIAVLAQVKGFNFKNSLMQEHFNESYAESDLYPKTTFTGNFLDYKSNVSGVYIIDGIFFFHGVQKQLTKIPFIIEFLDDNIKINGEFPLTVSDFDIKVPRIVQSKIPSKIYVYVEIILKSSTE